MLAVTPRRKNILTGAIAMVLLSGAVTIGVKGAFGAFDDGYEVVGRFDAAGQGLLPGSDIKVRGVDIGKVDSIELVDGEAEITMLINRDEQVAATASAIIRPKTLFGEKYIDIDPGAGEGDGPYLDDGDRIEDTQGGFELEQVLADTYPLLRAIDPAELMTVLGEMADAGNGLGDTINRSIVNGAELSQSFADSADDTREFLDAFASLSDELADDAEDLLAIADAANEALPVLNDGEDQLVDLLQQAGRLSNDVADLLEGNRGFVDAAMVDGTRSLQLLFDERDQVIPLVIGLRQYVQTLASVVRIDVGDGTLMAAVKGILGGDLCGVIPCPGAGVASSGAPPAPSAPPPPSPPPSPPLPSIDLPLDLGTSAPDDSLFGFLSRVLGA